MTKKKHFKTLPHPLDFWNLIFEHVLDHFHWKSLSHLETFEGHQDQGQ